MIRPRIRSLPPALGTRGGEVLELAERLGYTLDGWQRLALNDLLATDENGGLAAYSAALIVARQCGKSLIAELYATNFAAIHGEGVLFTSHRADSSKLIFRRLLAALPAEFGADPTFTNGNEEIRFPSGGKIMFRTRGPRVARGFSFDKIIIDEAQVLRPDDLDAMLPTLRTVGDPQVLYLGCAGNGLLNPHCAVLWALRERALRGDSDRLCLLEWSAHAVDDEGNELRADELTEEMLSDVELWRQAKPASDERIPITRMKDEYEALDATSFAVELLGVWIPPASDAMGKGPITHAAWDALIDEDSELDPAPTYREVIVSFDMSRERRGAVGLAGRRADELLTYDHVGTYAGAPAVVRAIEQLCNNPDPELDKLDVRYVVCDGTLENLDILARLLGENIITERQVRDDASRLGVQACATLTDLVAEQRFRHRGQHELRDALRGAIVKPLSESWVFSRSRSKADVSPLIAAACALHVADIEIEAGASATPLMF